MSSTIWMHCGGSKAIGPLKAAACRVVEDQFKISTRALVRSDDDHDLLESLIETAKPPKPDDPALERLHWLLHTPFRYHPPLLSGSRFGSRWERALWYGAEHVRTALAEKSYHWLLDLTASAITDWPVSTTWSDFTTQIATEQGVDLTNALFDAARDQIESPNSYHETQQLGGAMREAGVEAFRFRSVRDPQHGCNIGVIAPAAFAETTPNTTLIRQWAVLGSPDGVRIARKNAMMLDQRYEFHSSVFLTDGRFPDPRP